jgi:ADP-ribose pyrophosphatase YjhB (NUDIX family)
MYEVFLNDRKIIITDTVNKLIVKDAEITKGLNTVSEVKNWFQEFTVSETKTAVLVHPSHEHFWKNIFLPVFKEVPAAGGVVIRENKLLLIFRNEKWDLPKGKIDKGETAQEAAIREVAEECGIIGHRIIKKLPPTFHIYVSPWKETFGLWILKETHWFEMNYSGTENGKPETGENITEIRWFAGNELNEVIANTYESLKQIIMVYQESLPSKCSR